MRDTGSTTCVVKKSLVKPEQMTGSYELCMLIDGIVKRYPTAMVELDTPYFSVGPKFYAWIILYKTSSLEIYQGQVESIRTL